MARPFLKTRGFEVQTIFDYLADDYSLDEFLESFPSVTREAAISILLFGQHHIEEELAA